MKHFLLFPILLFLLQPIFAENASQKTVIVIHSYHPGYEWTDMIQRGIMETLSKNGEEPVSMYTHYLDTKHMYTAEIKLSIIAHLMLKYQSVNPDCIIVSDDNAYSLMLENRDQLFPGVPLVFCGINNLSDYPGVPRGVTGVTEEYDLSANFDLIEKIHPDTKLVVLVSDQTVTGKINTQQFAQIVTQRERKYNFRIIDNVTSEELATEIGKLPDDSVIFYQSFWVDKNNKPVTVDEATKIIAASRHPVYTRNAFMVKNGVVGGIVFSGYQSGREAASIALRIIDGTRVDAIPVQRSTIVPIFDYEALKTHRISNRLLPQESIFLNQELTIFQTHPKISFSLLSLVVLLFISLLSLWINFMSRLRTEHFLSSIVSNAPDIIAVTDQSNRILLVNSAIEAFVENDIEDLSGEPFPLFSQDYVRNQIDSVEDDLKPTILEFNDIESKRHFFEVISVPIRYKGQEALLSVLRDITVRKEYETKLQQSVKEKTVLIREIHHRVKNNLFIIISLLELQNAATVSSESKGVIETIQSRIISMSLVHDMLYAQTNLSMLDSNKYLTKLIETLKHIYSVAPAQDECRSTIESVELSTDIAVPLGLICTELITNSIKYGKNSEEIWEFDFNLIEKNGLIEISVQDRGPGFAFEKKNLKSLGLNLVDSLVTQLGGRVEFANKNGACCYITIPFSHSEDAVSKGI